MAVGALPKSIRETLSAFSNDRGELVLLGLAEESGCAPAAGFDAAKTRADLASLCSDVMEPPVRADVHIVDVEGAQIVVASVPEMGPGSKPCYVKAKRMAGGSYTRGGAGDRLLTAYEIFILHANRGQPQHDTRSSRRRARPTWIRTRWDACCAGSASVSRRRSARSTTRRRWCGWGVLRRTDAGAGVTLPGLLTLGQWPQQ